MLNNNGQISKWNREPVVLSLTIWQPKLEQQNPPILVIIIFECGCSCAWLLLAPVILSIMVS